MNKKLIRITESDFHKIVKETVNKVLNEIDYSSIPMGDFTERNKWWKTQVDNDFPNHGIKDSQDWQSEYYKLERPNFEKEQNRLRKEKARKTSADRRARNKEWEIKNTEYIKEYVANDLMPRLKGVLKDIYNAGVFLKEKNTGKILFFPKGTEDKQKTLSNLGLKIEEGEEIINEVDWYLRDDSYVDSRTQLILMDLKNKLMKAIKTCKLCVWSNSI